MKISPILFHSVVREILLFDFAKRVIYLRSFDYSESTISDPCAQPQKLWFSIIFARTVIRYSRAVRLFMLASFPFAIYVGQTQHYLDASKKEPYPVFFPLAVTLFRCIAFCIVWIVGILYMIHAVVWNRTQWALIHAR